MVPKGSRCSPRCRISAYTTVLAVYPEIENQRWDFADSSGNAAIDFAAIYQEYYRESRVPDLFDELVAQLEEIVNSGEIDSLQAIKALEKLILTIRKIAVGISFRLAVRGNSRRCFLEIMDSNC